ncbi:MAG: response regulator [Opitutaceae bacterium]|nr:response regulator [Opitutaceae bacterium]
MLAESTPRSALRLLHLEDNLADAELVQARLQDEWPDCQIKRVDTRHDFESALRDNDYDLILSDFSLPAFNGLEALDIARTMGSSTPFIFVSGTIGEDNAVTALKRGASDYVIKDRSARLVTAVRNAIEQKREYLRRRQAEQRLQEQAEYLDKARDAICVADMTGRVTYCNQSASRLFGWGADDPRPRLLQELFGLFNQNLVPEAMREVQEKGSWSGSMQLALEKSELRYIESRWTLVRDGDGRPKAVLLINTDITEQKKLESQLLRSQRLEAIGTLAGGIAHDLNNVLAPILMSVNLLQLKSQDKEVHRLVGVLERSAQHGADLLRQVLAFARGAEGERSEIMPQPVIKDVVTLLSETLPRSIVIHRDVPNETWPILANSTQFSQVMMNLGVNARDAMPGGGQLRIRTRNVVVDAALAQANPGARPGPHVMISVSDTGCGIPPDLIDRIFDPFFTTKTAGKGTGLGLSTVLGIVKGHGGFLQVRSEVGHGTEFILFFPAVRAKTSTDADVAALEAPRGNGETILVIEDEAAVREIARSLLEVYGFRPIVATAGPAGLQMYRTQRDQIHAVLTDMMMPTMQGAEVISELRALNPDVRIVAMSGVVSDRPPPEVRGRLAFVAKPMTGSDLVRAIHRVLVNPQAPLPDA